MGRKAKNNVTTRWPALVTGHWTGPSLPYGRLRIRRRDVSARRPWRFNGRSWVHQFRGRESESSVDVLDTRRGVVLGRAVTTLRSVETQTYAWGLVLSVKRDPTAKNRERENSEIVARTKWGEMANRLKFRETITKAEHNIRKHCTTIYIRGCTLTHTEKENIMKRSL